MNFVGVKLELSNSEEKIKTYDSDVILIEGNDDDVLCLGLKPKIIETIVLDESETEKNNREKKEKEKNQVEKKKEKGKEKVETDGNEADDEADDFEDPPSPPRRLPASATFDGISSSILDGISSSMDYMDGISSSISTE